MGGPAHSTTDGHEGRLSVCKKSESRVTDYKGHSTQRRRWPAAPFSLICYSCVPPPRRAKRTMAVGSFGENSMAATHHER